MSQRSDGAAPSHRRDTSRPRRAALGGALAVIVLATLLPTDDTGAGVANLQWCLRCNDFGGVDFLLNVALFVPLGAALAASGHGVFRVACRAAALSLGIEVLQLLVVPGRFPNLVDVVSNGAGGVAGALLHRAWPTLAVPAPRTARLLVAAALLLHGAIRLATVWLLEPSYPRTRWYGQVAASGVYRADFRGEVVEVRVDDLPVRTGAMPALEAVVRRPAWAARVRAVPAGPTASLAPVLSVLDDRRTEILVVGQDGRDARFRARLRAADLHLRVPGLRLVGAFAGPPRAEVALTASRAPGHLTLTRDDGLSATARLHAGLGWALLWPWDLSLPRHADLLSALWTALLMLPTLYWAGHVERRDPRARPAVPSEAPAPPRARAALGSAAGMLCVLLAPMALAGTPPPPVAETATVLALVALLVTRR